jgi:transketolase
MGLEDVAIMRALPNMSVLQPGDEIETKQAIRYLVSHRSGPTYIRLTRQKLQDVNGPDYKFRFGEGVVLRDGKDLTVVATGGVVHHALAAAEKLASDGLDVRVVNIHTIKPIDADLLTRCAEETGAVFTVEDHNIIGGLGGAVCEVLADRRPVPVKRWGLPDCFGESGSPEGLYEKYQFDAPGIAANVKEFARRLRRI